MRYSIAVASAALALVAAQAPESRAAQIPKECPMCPKLDETEAGCVGDLVTHQQCMCEKKPDGFFNQWTDCRKCIVDHGFDTKEEVDGAFTVLRQVSALLCDAKPTASFAEYWTSVRNGAAVATPTPTDGPSGAVAKSGAAGGGGDGEEEDGDVRPPSGGPLGPSSTNGTDTAAGPTGSSVTGSASVRPTAGSNSTASTSFTSTTSATGTTGTAATTNVVGAASSSMAISSLAVVLVGAVAVLVL